MSNTKSKKRSTQQWGILPLLFIIFLFLFITVLGGVLIKQSQDIRKNASVDSVSTCTAQEIALLQNTCDAQGYSLETCTCLTDAEENLENSTMLQQYLELAKVAQPNSFILIDQPANTQTALDNNQIKQLMREHQDHQDQLLVGTPSEWFLVTQLDENNIYGVEFSFNSDGILSYTLDSGEQNYSSSVNLSRSQIIVIPKL